MAGKFSSQHYFVGGIGILLSVICAIIINTILAATEMPTKRSDLACTWEKVKEEAPVESVPERTHLPGAGARAEHRSWRPSRWQAS